MLQFVVPKQKTSEYPPEYLQAAESIGRFMEYWGFKRIHGTLWTVLYLAETPLTQTQLQAATQYSKSGISMALKELLFWEVVRLERPLRGNSHYYSAETDIFQMIRRVLAHREIELLDAIKDALAVALVVAKRKGEGFAEDRLSALHTVTTSAHWTMEKFIKNGALPLNKINRYIEQGLSTKDAVTNLLRRRSRA